MAKKSNTKGKLNVAKAADKFLKEVDKDGFNGLSVVDLDYECCWHEQYAIFVLQFDTYFFDEESEYVRFDVDRFEEDLRAKLKEVFPGCKINYTPNCHEWEIIGPDYNKFNKKHVEEIEEIESNRGGRHWVFKPK